MTKDAVETYRLSLKLSERASKRLDAIRDTTDSSTTAEAIRLALRIADFVVEQACEGNKIVIRKPDGTESEVKLFY